MNEKGQVINSTYYSPSTYLIHELKLSYMAVSNFDPNGVGLKNGRFIGLPFEAEEANVVILPIPWDVTTSFGAGTARGPANILEASSQLDLEILGIEDAWKLGIYFAPISADLLTQNDALRTAAESYITFLENGKKVDESPAMKAILSEINTASKQLSEWIYRESLNWLNQGKLVGLVGGDHSVPLGFLKALATKETNFSILQIDAHMDLRDAYEGFSYSHASIFFNALKIQQIQQLTQVGIRDFCAEERFFANQNPKITVFFDEYIRQSQMNGSSFSDLAQQILNTLSDRVYISLDIDGLDPSLCPNTGTPVPGGFSYPEIIYLIKQLVAAGKTIIGFDLCEVAGSGNWDGNVGARLLYQLGSWMAVSNGVNY